MPLLGRPGKRATPLRLATRTRCHRPQAVALEALAAAPGERAGQRHVGAEKYVVVYEFLTIL